MTESKVAWEAIQEVIETNEFLLLFISQQCAYFLAKRVILPDELPALREFLRQHVSSPTRLFDNAEGLK
jgi:hypothetical protein